uniref:Uncharacterized protein n=1 Tax=Trichinella nativa TaxID=6335 RepID=A0A0V1KHZ6_9BILA
MRWAGHRGCVRRPPPSVGPQKQVILTSNSGIVLIGSGLNPSIQKASNYRNNTVLYE